MKFSEVTKNAKIEHDKIVNRLKDIPEVYDGLENVNVADIKEPFIIERYHVVTKPDTAKNETTGSWEVKTSKKGNVLTVTLIYALCHLVEDPAKRFYFSTKSSQMLTQLWTDDAKKTIKEGTNGEVEVWDMDEGIDEPLTIGFVKVKYRDGKNYDQPLLNVADVKE